jgi:hypothetical protein
VSFGRWGATGGLCIAVAHSPRSPRHNFGNKLTWPIGCWRAGFAAGANCDLPRPSFGVPAGLGCGGQQGFDLLRRKGGEGLE